MYNSNEFIYVSLTAKDYLKSERDIRNNVYSDGHLTFFTTEEPFYTLTGYDIETGVSYCTMWNSKGTVSFKYSSANYTIQEDDYYSDELKRLVSDWQIETIKQNINEKGSDFGGLDITARVIYFKETGDIDEIETYGFSEYDGSLK